MGYVETVAHKISSTLAARLGIPEPPNAWKAFAAQVTNETAGGDPSTRGVRDNNPLNLTTAGGTIEWPGEIGRDGPFAIFGSVDAGIAASVQNLFASSYEGIRNAFASGDPVALAHAIEASPWDAGHYGYNLAALIPGGSSMDNGPTSSTPVGASGECPPGWRLHHEGAGTWCVPNSPGDIVPGITGDIGGAITKQITDPLGKGLEDFRNMIGSGVRELAVAGVVIGAIILLARAGAKRVLP